LLNVSQFGFRARQSTMLQCIRLTDHVTLISNSNVQDCIEEAFDTTWNPGLL